MRLVVVCSAAWERAVVRSALPDVLILSGADSDDLAAHLPSDVTHFAAIGICAGLSSHLQVADVQVGGLVVDEGGHDWVPDPAWSMAVLNAISIRASAVAGDDRAAAAGLARARLCPWYSAKPGKAELQAPDRGGLFAQSGAWALDEVSHQVAAFAEAKALHFIVVGACSDDASGKLSLAARRRIMSTADPAERDRCIRQVFRCVPQGRALARSVIADFDAALAALRALAPALPSSTS